MATPLQGPSQIMRSDERLVVTRKGPIQYVDGKPVYAVAKTFDIIGSVQPLAGRDLLLVPEGDRYKEQFWIWTPNDIKVNDIVTRCGANYQVQNVQGWRSYNQAMMTRLDVGPNATP